MNRAVSRSAAAIFILASLTGCGSGTITFGSGDDDDNPNAKVTFKGNLDSVTPVTSRDIVVFVYNVDDLAPDPDESCACPSELTQDELDTLPGGSALLPSGETDFTVSGLDPGAFRVVFLLDKAGSNADGQIDPGDQIAILDDIDCKLDDVDSKLTVNLESVDIAFSVSPTEDCQVGGSNPPAQGRARANRITFSTTTSSGN